MTDAAGTLGDPRGDARDRYTREAASLADLAPAARLAVAGGLLRRSRALQVDGAVVDAALGQLKGADITAWLSATDVDGALGPLSEGLDEALEAALADDDTERAAHATVALEALARRDRLASVMAAIDRWESAGGALGAEALRLRDRMRAELAKRDGELGARARWLVSLNAARRDERDLLDEGSRANAWWYAARTDCDGLLAVLTGSGPVDEQHFAECAACAADRTVSAVVDTPPARHVSEEELWGYDLGMLSKAEKRWVTAHASECGECKLALKALAEGERAIEESSDGKRSAAAENAAASAPEAEHRETVLEREEVVVFLFQSPKRSRVVVEPRAPHELRAAALAVPPAAARKGRRTARGFEFEVAARKGEGQKVRLHLELGSKSLDLELTLVAPRIR